ncbi:MAG TPA: DUF2147 domain-containing protein [Sphingomicrobium sp.]|jgi:uncharacterized protein (DUF2147 family)|nr:DUF2147 domain-containing protein [Sphingomicrobium sp.]
MPVLALIAALAVQAAPQAASASSIEGIWRSPGGNTIISIAACGSGPCGTVAWGSDKAKKDASKTTPQLLGTQLLTNLEQRKDGSWLGKLFIPDRNMRVTAKIQALGPGQLKVSGCAAGKALCKAQIWTSFTTALPTDTSVPAPK